MATYDLTKGGTSRLPLQPGKARVVKREVDFSEQNLAVNDVAQVIPVPADTMVVRVSAEVTEASTAAATIDIGDGADPDGYVDGLATNSTGFSPEPMDLTTTTFGPATQEAYGAGKFYSAADTIDVTCLTTALSDGTVVVKAAMIDFSDHYES